ncbi:metallophosphoesterase [Tundrisphaera lichenicola]|uniref:metallophosphoesterase n=1 Tax=Tundrisphaera lichenicola TaxID=2029860 RepID=UPI003EC02070
MIDGPEGWKLAPEGAAVHPVERTAVIADVHLGYEWARASGGDCLPAHSLAETLAKLSTLLGRVPISRLVVAGDLVESPAPCRRTASDLRSLYEWLDDRGVEMVPVLGNHDPQRSSKIPLTLEVAGWTIAHGHRPIKATRTISGHHHPVLRAGGLTAPCFVVGPRSIVLPAFTPNAAGLPVGSPGMPERWSKDDVRCVAGLGGELLDFGPLPSLILKLQGR